MSEQLDDRLNQLEPSQQLCGGILMGSNVFPCGNVERLTNQDVIFAAGITASQQEHRFAQLEPNQHPFFFFFLVVMMIWLAF